MALSGAISLCLLFVLIAGISASVDTTILMSRFKATKSILTGFFCQFLLLPLIGFATVRIFSLDDVYGITLIATTCSPGGAYSNLWCSLFNADLALSIAMTTYSTLISVACMPLNLLLYVQLTYGTSFKLDWSMLMASLAVALSAIFTGISVGYVLPRRRGVFNAIGNIAGLALIVLGALTSSRKDPLWDKEAIFYIAVATPCITGLMVAYTMSYLCGLHGPQRVAVTVETCYQNTGVALSMVLATFPESVKSAAAGVPLVYGVVEVLVLPLFLLLAWQFGLTYAPRTDRLCTILFTNYQPSPQADCARETTDAVPEQATSPAPGTVGKLQCQDAGFGHGEQEIIMI